MAKTTTKFSIRAAGQSAHHFKGDVLVLGLYKETRTVPSGLGAIDQAAGGAITRALALGDFKGNRNETSIVYVSESFGCPRILLVGLGEPSKTEPDVFRQAMGTTARALKKFSAEKVGIVFAEHKDARATAPETLGRTVSEGLITGYFVFDEYLSDKNGDVKKPSKIQVTIFVDDQSAVRKVDEGCRVGSILAEGQNLARWVAAQPGNRINPETLAREARSIAREYKLKCTVYNEKQLGAMKMNAILAVGGGSASKPRLIKLEYNGRRGASTAKGPDAVVVGKAITFDSGGIDLKPPVGMEMMKHDKAGGCSVLGIMAAASRAKLPLRLIGLIPAAENLISGTSYRPGDIVRTYSGKTVEIINTDAEGRMLLADALAYATEMKPGCIIDLATLTGACAIALGEHYAGLFGNDDSLVSRLKEASDVSGERAWPLPCGPEYLDSIKNGNADLKNVGSREGGASIAAAFLSQFVGDTPWAHVDIARVAKPEAEKPWRSSGVTGFGVRLVLEYLRSIK